GLGNFRRAAEEVSTEKAIRNVAFRRRVAQWNKPATVRSAPRDDGRTKFQPSGAGACPLFSRQPAVRRARQLLRRLPERSLESRESGTLACRNNEREHI